MNGNRFAASALLVAVFVAGGVTGVALWQLIDGEGERVERPFERADRDRHGSRADRDRGPERSGPAPMRFTRRLAERLELTDGQTTAIGAIIEAREEASAQVLREMRPQLRAQLDSMNAAIRELLTVEQQERFDELLESSRERFRRGGRDGDGRRGSDRRRSPPS